MYVFIIDILAPHNPIQVAGAQRRDPQFPKRTLYQQPLQPLDWLCSPTGGHGPGAGSTHASLHLLVPTTSAPPHFPLPLVTTSLLSASVESGSFLLKSPLSK